MRVTKELSVNDRMDNFSAATVSLEQRLMLKQTA